MLKMRLFLILIPTMLFIQCDDDSTFLTAVSHGELISDLSDIEFSLDQNHPNPFNPSTTIEYSTTVPVNLNLKVYTEDWLLVNTLVDSLHPPGHYFVHFLAHNQENEELPSGDYVYTLEGNGIILIRQMKLMK